MGMPSSSDWVNIPSTVACHAPGSRQASGCTTTSAVLRKMWMCSPTRTDFTPDSTGLSNGRCATAGRVHTSTLGHVWRGDVQPVTVRDAGVQTLLCARCSGWRSGRSPGPCPRIFRRRHRPRFAASSNCQSEFSRGSRRACAELLHTLARIFTGALPTLPRPAGGRESRRIPIGASRLRYPDRRSQSFDSQVRRLTSPCLPSSPSSG
jgi:hypothetical protein